MTAKFWFACLHSLVALFFSQAASLIDQSQTGELNVHVNLKDVRVIALLKSSKEEYVDYDYAYDYSEMTIKPQNSTTVKPLNVTISDIIKDNNTDTTTEMIVEITPSIKNATFPVPMENGTAFIVTTSSSVVNLDTTQSSSVVPIKKPVTSTPQPVNGTECKKGFTVNKKGECEIKITPSSTNALLKLVKLSQKLKLRREN